MRRILRICALAAAWILLLAGSLEIGSRLYWKLWHGVPFFRPGDVLYVFYPNVETLGLEANRPDAARRDILVLGGSVVDEMRGDFEALGRSLEGYTEFHVAGRVAHSTVDSLRKVDMLADLDYDEILVYHGINDCKYNNVPDDLFNDDYTAYPFYRLTSSLLHQGDVEYLSLPFTLRFLWFKLVEFRGDRWRRPTATARAEWQTHGSDIKTARSFRSNMEAIVERARANGWTVRLATFAWYIPEGYTEERFLAGELDYSTPRLRVGIWGRAGDVSACIEVHNEIVRELAAKTQGVKLIDLEAAVPKEGLFFDDPCHLSPDGKTLFFEALGAAF